MSYNNNNNNNKNKNNINNIDTVWNLNNQTFRKPGGANNVCFYSGNRHTGNLFVATGNRAVSVRKSVGGKRIPFCFKAAQHLVNYTPGIQETEAKLPLDFNIAFRFVLRVHNRVTRFRAGTRTRPGPTGITSAAFATPAGWCV